jgi:hypothetical protein
VYPRAVRSSFRIAALSLPAALAALAAPRPAAACATAPPQGTFAQIAEESAIVIWDDKSRTEHFIRRAAFHTTDRSVSAPLSSSGRSRARVSEIVLPAGTSTRRR